MPTKIAAIISMVSNGSTVNFLHGEIVANLSVVALGAGDVCLRSNVDVQIVVLEELVADAVQDRLAAPPRLAHLLLGPLAL